MSYSATASPTSSSPTLVQPEGTPAHVATLTTAELDTVCVEIDRYLAAFSHHARAAPEPLRAIAEQAWFNMNAMFTMYLRELEGRGHHNNAADGDLAQKFPGRSMDNGRCPRSPRVRYGPRERPRKSGPHKNLKGQVSTGQDDGLSQYGTIRQPDFTVVFTTVLSGNKTKANTTAEHTAVPHNYPLVLTYTAPVGHLLRPVRPLPPTPPVPPVCNSAGYQRHPQVAGCEGDADGQGRKGDGAEEQLKRAGGDKEGQSDNRSKKGRRSGKATKEEEGERMEGFLGSLVFFSEASSEDRLEAWRHAVAEAGAEDPDDASGAVDASTADDVTEEIPMTPQSIAASVHAMLLQSELTSVPHPPPPSRASSVASFSPVRPIGDALGKLVVRNV